MIGPGCESVARLLATFVQQGLTVQQSLEMPFVHPLAVETLRAGLSELQRSLERKPLVYEDLPVVQSSRRSCIGMVVT